MTLHFWLIVISSLFIHQFTFCQTFDLSGKTKGQLVTMDNQTINGEISFSKGMDGIMIQGAGYLRQYHIKEIKEVIIQESNATLRYVPLREKQLSVRLFLVVSDQEPKLYTKEDSYGKVKGGNAALYTAEDNMAVLIAEDDKEFFNLFGKYKKEVRDFSFSRNLRPDNFNDVLEILEYYRQLSD